MHDQTQQFAAPKSISFSNTEGGSVSLATLKAAHKRCLGAMPWLKALGIFAQRFSDIL